MSDEDAADRLRELVNDWDFYTLRLDKSPEWRDEMRRAVLVAMRAELEQMRKECGLERSPISGEATRHPGEAMPARQGAAPDEARSATGRVAQSETVRTMPPVALTAEEFERAYAERSGVTVEWLRAHGRVVRPCQCGSSLCEGWQSISQESADDQA